jgi:ATP synthase protein I
VAEDGKDDDMKARLESLSTALDAQATQEHKRDPGPVEEAGRSLSQAANLGFRVLTEFVAAVLVSGLIGWKFDDWFSTAPLFLICFLGLGTVAGFWNVYRIAVQPTGSPGGMK